MKEIPRTLAAKAISYSLTKNKRDGKYKDWKPTRIEDLLKSIISKSPTVEGRHYPDRTKAREGTDCFFINTWKDLGKNGLLFDVFSYTQGHVPETIAKDFNQKEVNPKAIDLAEAGSSNSDAKKVELVFHYRCIALGQTLIIEQVSGSKGTGGLRKLLNGLARRHIDRTHPPLGFNDFASQKLRELIKQKGGVSKIQARLVDQPVNKGSKFGGRLSRTREEIPGANKCMVTWAAEDSKELDTETSISLFEEAEDSSSLAGVTLHFVKGGSIGDLSSYTEKKPIKVQKLASGLPAINEIEEELKQYLNDLRHPKNDTPINTDGSVKNVDFLKVK